MKPILFEVMEWLGILAAIFMMLGVIVGVPWLIYSFATYNRNWCREFGHARADEHGRCGRCRRQLNGLD